jgi:hypothetical protein
MTQKLRFTDTANKWEFQYSRQAYFYKDTRVQINETVYKALTTDYGPNILVLTREDTLAGKVYLKRWRSVNNYIGNGIYIKDTAEFVWYNYSLNKGDTMTIPMVFDNAESMKQCISWSIKML